MSVPFSNTHLRIPRGFGTVLEGLAREVLRDQPEDVPQYAANYFNALLKQREESGMDPAEWAAKLEDRFYNNHAFKATQASPEKEPVTEVPVSKQQSQTANRSSHSAESSKLSITQANFSEEDDLTEGTEGEEKSDMTGKHSISLEEGISTAAADVQSDELSGMQEEKEPAINTLDKIDWKADDKDSSPVPGQHGHQTELESTNLLSVSGVSNVDICAQETGMAEYERGDKEETVVVGNEILDSEEEENTDVEEPEVFPYPGPANMNVCATELRGTERTVEGAGGENETDAIEEESLKPQPEPTLVQSSPSHFETPESNQQEGEDQSAKTKEEERTEAEASSGETHRSLAHIEGGLNSNATPKEDSLVEISFEDVPEAQQITEAREKKHEGEGSAEELQAAILEMHQEEVSKGVTAAATEQTLSGTQHHDEVDMEGDAKELNSEGEEKKSQLEASDVMKVDTNDSHSNDSDDEEKGEGVGNIHSSHQPDTKADKENPEDERKHTNEENENTIEDESGQTPDSEKETQSSDWDFKGDETADMVRGDNEGILIEGHGEMEDEDIDGGDSEHHSSQVTQSKTSTAAMEVGSESLEASVQHLPEESPRTLVESQQEDTVEEKEVTLEEVKEVAEVGESDSEVQKRSDATHEEESVSLTLSADGIAAGHQGEERPLGPEKDTTEPEGRRCDKQEECSRPQEEEDIMDIPLDDPEANRAAAKIQAGFRGHMTRKKMKPEDKAEGEEVSSTGDVLNGSQGDTETGGSGAVERDDTSVPEQ